METLIRLSTAHARARLSKTIDAVDAKEAVELVQYSHYQKVLEKPRRRKAGADEGSAGESEEEEMEVDEVIPSGTASRRAEAKRPRDVYEYDGDAEEDNQGALPSPKVDAPKPRLIELSDERLKAFRQFLFKIFRKEMSQSLLKSKVYEAVREEASGEGALKFTNDEVESALHKMQDNNMVFLSGDLVILV